MNNKKSEIIFSTEMYVKEKLKNDTTGHDWWHIFRVRNLAMKIADKEGGDRFLIEIAALLHDIDDWKFAENAAQNRAETWLNSLGIPQKSAKGILEIIEQVSFKGSGVENTATTTESKIVQDADRLDAIGAIGVARTFAYGGSRGRPIFDPNIKPESHDNFEAYKRSAGPTINHFYEKLLLLKYRLNIETAQKIAERRHRFMERFLDEFFREWDEKAEI